ncbi:MAG: prefoldin subunit beta [Candidatus Aenigmarchaeota archaeon]|nr:prefoldin subunit beta [Candidatus Aenigmarchaeota archaeon]
MAENLEELLGHLQMQNQQLQNVMMQKQALIIQTKEIEKALEEISREDSEEIYRSVGPILVKADKEKVKKDLEEQKEEMELKIKSLEKQESRLKSLMKEGQEKFQSLHQGG